MAHVVRFDQEGKPIPGLSGDCHVSKAESILGRWLTAGYDLCVYYVDARDEDEYGPIPACFVVAWKSQDDSYSGPVFGSAWMLEPETGDYEPWA